MSNINYKYNQIIIDDISNNIVIDNIITEVVEILTPGPQGPPGDLIEDLVFQVKNQTGTTIPKGTSVRFDGVVGGSGRIDIAPFLADGTFPSSYFLGVTAQALLDGEDGKVISHGKIRGIDTDAFTIGDILYASTTVAGGLQTTPPIAPNNIITVAAVINQGTSNGEILVRPQLGSNINLDEGIKIISGSTGDLLQLQSNGLWENKPVVEVALPREKIFENEKITIKEFFQYNLVSILIIEGTINNKGKINIL